MRILLADGQQKVRFALRVLLEHQTGLKIVGEVTDAQALFNSLQIENPDIILLDWDLPGLTVENPLSAVRQRHPNLCVIALSGKPGARQSALKAGADAFVSKGDSPERLLAAIKACHSPPAHRPNPRNTDT